MECLFRSETGLIPNSTNLANITQALTTTDSIATRKTECIDSLNWKSVEKHFHLTRILSIESMKRAFLGKSDGDDKQSIQSEKKTSTV